MKNLAEYMKRFLCHRKLEVYITILAVLLVSPALWTGWQLDDFVHRYYLLGFPGIDGTQKSPLDLFSFLDGIPSHNHDLMDAGLLPWWTFPGLRLSFWRPLTGLSHALDYALWPATPALMHLQNLFWFAAVILVATRFYKRFVGLFWAAGLAALLFSIDDAHGLPAGWLSNRNALLSAFFGFLVLVYHDKWRREGNRRGAVLGPSFMVISLLAGEAAVAVVAYLLAYSLFLDSGSWRQRLLALMPYSVITGVWLLAYRALGHGTYGSGFYVDPLSEPLLFAQALVERAPILLLDQFGFPPSSFYAIAPSMAISMWWILSIVILVIMGLAFLPLLQHDKTSRFYAMGMVLSLPIVCATVPHGRLLFFAGIGGMGLTAQWLAAVYDRASWLPDGKRWQIIARSIFMFLIVVHAILAPLSLPLNATGARLFEPYVQQAAATAQSEGSVQGKVLIILNHPSSFLAQLVPTVWFLSDKPIPRRFRVLASGDVELRVTRLNERTLTIRPEGGFLRSFLDRLYRGPSQPMHSGERVELAGMTVQITGMTPDKRPAEAQFEFDRSLENESLMWMKWENGKFVPFEIPKVGESEVLPPASMTVR